MSTNEAGIHLEPPPVVTDFAPDPRKVGMLAFLLSEVAFFTTLIVTFLYFLGPIRHGEPNPRQVFDIPMVLVSTLCLLSSSGTMHMAHKSLTNGQARAFLGWWAATIVLGLLFLGGTALEWNDLINRWHVTISRNLFGTCYFTLVGFHAAHVTVGVTIMILILALGLRREVSPANPIAAELVSWYWHFVDGVWVVVFTVVYVLAR
jgi:cytochrome c oxidase subunit 3/cytochrome o ubiquinol oxidase subunit 3